MHLDVLYVLYITRLFLAIILTAVFIANMVALLISLFIKSDFRIYSQAYGIAYNHASDRERWTRFVYRLRNMPFHRIIARIALSVAYVVWFVYYFCN